MFDMWRVRSWNSTSGHYNKMLWKVLMTESQSHTYVFLTGPEQEDAKPPYMRGASDEADVGDRDEMSSSKATQKIYLGGV